MILKKIFFYSIFFVCFNSCRPSDSISSNDSSADETDPKATGQTGNTSCESKVSKMYAPPDCSLISCIYKCSEGSQGSWYCKVSVDGTSKDKSASEINAKETEGECKKVATSSQGSPGASSSASATAGTGTPTGGSTSAPSASAPTATPSPTPSPTAPSMVTSFPPPR